VPRERKDEDTGLDEVVRAAKTRAKSSTAQELKQELRTGRKAEPIVRPSVFEKDLDYLLQHAEDRESHEKKEKRVWLEHYERFREQAPKVMVSRLEGILQDKAWIRNERPVEPARQWVLYGIDFAREVLRPQGEHEAWGNDVLQRARELDYEGAKKLLAQVLRFQRASDYDAFLLSLTQTYILDHLDKVWYTGIVGSMSSGKTTATKVWAYLGDCTYHVATVSAAAIVAIMQKARGLTIDEVDATLKRSERDLVEALLRQGIERGQPYVKMMEVLEGGQRQHVLQAVPTFGPKAFNYRGKLEDALTSRADLIEMKRAKDPALRRRARRYREILAPLKAWLEQEAEKALAQWTRERVHAYEASEEFIARSDALRIELDRTGEIGDLMLLVAKVMEWPVEKVIQERLDGMSMAIEEPIVEEVREEVLKMAEQAEYKVGDEWRFPKAELKARLDLARKDRGERPIWKNDLAAALRELDLSNESRPSHKDRRRCLILSASDIERLKTSLGGDGIVGTVGTAPLARWDNEAVPSSKSRDGTRDGTTQPPVLGIDTVPSVPSVPSLPIGEGKIALLRGRLLDRALDRFREDPQQQEDWVEQDLVLAHQIPEKDRPAVKEIVHRARLQSLREMTPQSAASAQEASAAPLREDRACELEMTANSEKSSVGQAGGLARKEERVKRGVRSLAVLEHLRSPEATLEEIAAHVVELLRMHGHVVDLEYVKAEAKDVIERAIADRGSNEQFVPESSGSSDAQGSQERPSSADVARASQSEGFKGGPRRQPEEGGPQP